MKVKEIISGFEVRETSEIMNPCALMIYYRLATSIHSLYTSALLIMRDLTPSTPLPFHRYGNRLSKVQLYTMVSELVNMELGLKTVRLR